MLQEFINYLEEQVANHSIYIWGAQGQNYPTVCEAWITKKESGINRTNALKTYRAAVNAGYKTKLRAFDCSGLGVYFLYNLKKLIPCDKTADGLKGLCTKIKRRDLRKGDWVFKTYSNGRAYHIGYVVDDQLNVIEARGRAYGVVKRPLSKSGWNAFGRPNMFKVEIESPAEKPTQTGDKCIVETVNIKKGSKGNPVKAMQQLLNLRINAGLAVDGDCGTKSDAAIRSYQKAKGLTTDGICGAKTWTKLING